MVGLGHYKTSMHERYVSGTDSRVPKEEELMVINDHIARTIKGRDHGFI
jgi:hypothetical protein